MNFTGFSSDSFEQLIRDLALRILGPGVSLFGNGPDGGREATFNGKVNFPFPPTDIWDGYGVIQSKFKEKTEDTNAEQIWAERQLKLELQKWTDRAKRNPKPDYFIFCTNVELTSASGGGRDRLTALLDNAKLSLGIKGYSIWDATQLNGYITHNIEVRKRFTCFFTPGDVLAEIAKHVTGTSDADAILTAFLIRSLIADEDARLSQAGDRSEDRIRLAQVFVDLPVFDSRESDTDQASTDRQPCSLEELLRAGSRKLDPLALYEYRSSMDDSKGQSQRLLARFIYLGGPGSGKSTIGQFFAQIHRAAILARRPPHKLEEKTIKVIEEIRRRCNEESINWPTTPRYPFRVELNAFAKALDPQSKERVSSLSEYLRRTLSTDERLDHSQLREWLRLFPWVLILDGLDEVPASSNRKEVIAAIHSFLSEARDVDADLLIVASSRPDGYAGEFDSDDVGERFLAPLSNKRALDCAKRYLVAKHQAKEDPRIAATMATLTEAVQNPLIARLMRSPLQVTFMVTVVAASGKPSDSRWQLFSDYYRTIYERELHKAVRPFDAVLNERRQDIDALHHRVGFILQCRGEVSGGTEATLTMDEFARLATACLEENGLSPELLTQQRDLIVGAASQRLVFLVSRTPGKLSFDVRSLQEYMAASCITNADSNEVLVRMDTIAHSSYWRNTLFFAVGRFFVEPQMRNYRDKIRTFCEDLNRKDNLRSAAKLGSIIALGILESGTVGNVPLINRSLANCALQILSFSPDPEDVTISKLAEVCDDTIAPEFKQTIDLWLSHQDLSKALPAWMLTLQLEKRNVAWANEFLMRHWPSDPQHALSILSLWMEFSNEDWEDGNVHLDAADTGRLADLIPRISIGQAESLLTYITVVDGTVAPKWLLALVSWWHADHIDSHVVIDGMNSGLGVMARSVAIDGDMAPTFADLHRLSSIPNAHDSWAPLSYICDFYHHPTIDSLAKTLLALRNIYDNSDNLATWLAKVPWPIACCLRICVDETTIDRFHTGLVGNSKPGAADWITDAEFAKEAGVSFSQLCKSVFPGGPALIHGVRLASVTSPGEDVAFLLEEKMLDWMEQSPDIHAKRNVGDILAFYASCTGGWKSNPERIESLVVPIKESWWDWHFGASEENIEKNKVGWITFYDRLGRLGHLKCSGFNGDRVPLGVVLQALQDNPDAIGLAVVAGYWAAAGRNPLPRVSIDRIIRYATEPQLRLGVLLIGITNPTLSMAQAMELSSMMPALVADRNHPHFRRALLTALEDQEQKRQIHEMLVGKLVNLIPSDDWRSLGTAETLRRSVLQAAPSMLDNEQNGRLGLPMLSLQSD